MSKKVNKITQTLHTPWLKYILITVAFLVWVGFFDKKSFLEGKKLAQEIQDLQSEYESLSADRQAYLDKIKSLKEEPERFAREKYYMHKEDEIVFILD